MVTKSLMRKLSAHLDHMTSFGEGEGSIIHSVVPSPKIRKKKKTTKSSGEEDITHPVLSFVVIYTMIFFNGCCFTAVVPSVPFYLQVLNAPPSFLGWVVSFYSLGQIFGSPIGGWMADKVSSRCLLTLSSTIGLLSSALYSVAPVYMYILVSRFLTGVSAGMEFSVELTFISRNTTKKERTAYLASVTAVNVIGFILGPALGGLLATLDVNIFGLVVDKYTGPGWLLTLMFMVDIILIQTLFEDNTIDEAGGGDKDEEFKPTEEARLLAKKDAESNQSYGGLDNSEEKFEDVTQAKVEDVVKLIQSLRDSQRPPPVPMVLGLIFVQFTVMSAWSVLETITSPLAQDNFDWDVQECNLLFTGGGFVSLVAYVIFVVASKWVQDRWLIVYALIVCVAGQMLAIDWQQDQWWWFPTSHLPSFRDRFLLGYALMNGGFMTGRPVTFALYSKLIGAQYQGKYLGWMVAGGSLARTLGPFFAVAVYYGVRTAGVNLLALFGTVGLFHVACLLVVMYLWHQLLPKQSQTSIRAGRGDEEEGFHRERHATEKLRAPDRMSLSSMAKDITSFNSDEEEVIYTANVKGKRVHLSLRVTELEKSGV